MADTMQHTPGLKRILALARDQAAERGYPSILPEHFILAIIARGGGFGSQLLEDMEIDPNLLQRAILEALPPPGGNGVSGAPAPDESSRRVLEMAREIAREMNCSHLSTEHLFLAVIREGKASTVGALENCGVTYDKASETALAMYDRMAVLMASWKHDR